MALTLHAQMQAKQHSLIAGALVGVFALVLLLAFLRKPTPQRLGGFKATNQPTDAADISSRANHNGSEAPVRSTLEASVNLEGRVSDAAFGIPVAALLQSDSGIECLSSGESGRFSIPCPSGGCSSLKITAAGHKPLKYGVPSPVGVEGVEIRLESSRVATIVLVNSMGIPQPHFQIDWRAAVDRPEREQVGKWIEARAQVQGSSVTRETDMNGMASLAIAVPAVAAVRDFTGQSLTTIRLQPGEAVKLCLPDTPIRLELLDNQTRQPLPGQELEVWYPRQLNAMSEVVSANQEGFVQLNPTSFPILIRVPGPEVWQLELNPLSTGMSKCGFGGNPKTMIKIEESPGSETLLVGVRQSGLRVQLVDGESGDPVDNPTRIQVRGPAACPDINATPFSDCTVFSPRSSFGRPDEIYTPKHGILELPLTVVGAATSSDDASTRLNLVFAASGYLPQPSSFRMNDLSGSGMAVSLHRARQRSLRVVYDDGTPFTQSVGVYSPIGNVMCWSSDGTSGGVHGMFDWFGGDLLVSVNSPARWDYRLREDDLSVDELVTLVVPDDKGAIVVDDIQDPTIIGSLVAKRGLAIGAPVYKARLLSPKQCSFESIPAGTYLVGPESWVLGAELQSMTFNLKGDDEPHQSRVIVRPGATTTVSWVNSWSAGRSIEGQVHVGGPAPIQPLLFPLYGQGGPRAEDLPGEVPNMYFGRRSPRIPVEVDGTYHIEPTDPLPRVIAICAADEANWGDVAGMHLLDVLLPGESAEIRTGSVELTAKGAIPKQSVTVSYEVPMTSFRHPLNTYYSTYQCMWDATTPLRIDGIPIQVKEMRIADQALPVELSAQKRTAVVAEF